MTKYLVSILAEVDDEAALITAAKAKLRAKGEDADALSDNPGDALRWLLDPALANANDNAALKYGVRVEDSWVEEVAEECPKVAYYHGSFELNKAITGGGKSDVFARWVMQYDKILAKYTPTSQC